MKHILTPIAAMLAATAVHAADTKLGYDKPAGQHWTKPYNIVWNTPGTKGYDSMPAGGGNISLNVWAEKDALVCYIGSTDSFDANEGLTKLARIRVTVSPNPFAADLRRNSIWNPIPSGSAAAPRTARRSP